MYFFYASFLHFYKQSMFLQHWIELIFKETVDNQ